MRYSAFEKELAKIFKVSNREAKTLCANFVQAFKNVILKKNEIEINNLGKFSLGYYPERRIMHPIYKQEVISFPFRKIFFKQSDEIRVVLNPHERYAKRPVFYNYERRKKASQTIYKAQYEEFVKSFVRYQKLKLIENMTFEEYLDKKKKEESNG